MRLPFFSRIRSGKSSPSATAVEYDPLDAIAWEQVVKNGGVTLESVKGAGNRPEDIQKLISAALRRGNFDEVDSALAELREQISPETWNTLADSFLAQNKYREAVECFTRASNAEGSKRALTDLRAGIISSRSPFNMRYFVEIFELVERRPPSVLEKIAMADEAFELGNLNQANYLYYEIPHQERTLHISRRLGDIEMLKMAGEKSECQSSHLHNAVAFYKEARYEEGLRIIAQYYASSHNFEGIIDIFKFLGVKPDLEWCGKIISSFNDDPVAIAKFLVKIGYPEEVIRLGNVCLTKGNLCDAEACFSIAGNCAGLKKIGDAYYKKGKFFMAWEIYQNISYEPVDPVFYEGLAREFIRQGNIRAAQYMFRRAIELNLVDIFMS